MIENMGDNSFLHRKLVICVRSFSGIATEWSIFCGGNRKRNVKYGNYTLYRTIGSLKNW